MQQVTKSNYWISNNAISITLNAMGMPNYIQCSCASNAVIMVYIKGIIDVDAGHNYQTWDLSASPTCFNTNTQKYVYIAVPRSSSSKKAIVVFPSELIDIYGKNEAEQQIGSEDYYYLYTNGIITSSGDNGTINRDWADDHRIETGILASDEARDSGFDSLWYKYSTVDGVLTFIKDLTMKAGTIFLNLYAKVISIAENGKIEFNAGGVIERVADEDTSSQSNTEIVTPAYGNNNYLSKKSADSASGKITFLNGIDIFGNTTFGTYNKGLNGGRIDQNGNAELNSLTLRETLNVPKLNYLNVTVIDGYTIRSAGGGTIEKTLSKTIGSVTYYYAKLKLDDGQIGKVMVNDYCKGFFHMSAGNATETNEKAFGNETIAGFTSVYFLIVKAYKNADAINADTALKSLLTDDEINNAKEYQYIRYYPRFVRESEYTDTTLPQPGMDFAVVGNGASTEDRAYRQNIIFETPLYEIMLINVRSWTYNSYNIAYIRGNLNGFTIDTESGSKALSGHGIAFGKAYMWGNIDQFDRAKVIRTSTPHYLATSATSVTTSTEGWTSQPQQPSSSKIYLWRYDTITYSDDSTENNTPYIIGNYAKDGSSISIKGSAAKHFDSREDFEAYNDKVVGKTYIIDEDEEDNTTSTVVKWTGDYPAYYPWATEGDIYINSEDGHMYVAHVNAEWTDAGQIQGASIEIRYSADNSTWHNIYQTNDMWMQIKFSNGDWSESMRINAADGKQLRPRGLWKNTDTYVNDATYRDVVIYNGNTYTVKSSISTVPEGTLPTNTTYWTAANEMKFVATQLLLAELASIDNLVLNKMNAYPCIDGVFDTTSPMVSIDGDTGKLTAQNADIQGNIEADTGSIGGFEIASGRIGLAESSTNYGLSLLKEYILYRDKYRKAMFGTTHITGQPYMAYMQDTSPYRDTDTDKIDMLPHSALVFKVPIIDEGYHRSAICGEGNIVMNGLLEGYKVYIFTPSSSLNTIRYDRGNKVLIKGTYGSVFLPPLSSVRSALNIVGNTDTFCVQLMIIAGSGTSFHIYSGSYGPTMISNDYGTVSSWKMTQGDVVTFQLVYDGESFKAFFSCHSS